MKKYPIFLALLLSLAVAGCGSSLASDPSRTTASTATSTPSSGTHSLRDWLVNYETYGSRYEPTIDFDAYEEAVTVTLGVPQSDGIWAIALYAEKGWRDGRPHKFYLQIGTSELGGIGGSYTYKHFGPYTDDVLALVREARGLKINEMIAKDIQVISEVVTASTTQN
jgi:hypothetical protein